MNAIEKTTTLDRRYLAVLATAIAIGAGACKTSGGDDADDTSGDPPPPTQANVGVGCYSASFSALDSNQIGCGIINSFGDPAFDLQFSQEISIQANFWTGVPATVYAFDECSPDRANALAHPDHYIMMGYWMARDVVFTTGSALPVAGVLAHEYGHQVQFQFGWISSNEPTARRTELEADMWSGFYMALAKAWTGSEINTYFQYIFSIGDFNFHHPGHHGTPNQRLAAGTVGYNVGYQVGITGQPLSYVELHNIFLAEVDRIVSTVSSDDAGFSKPEHALSAAAESAVQNIDRDLIGRILSGSGSLDEKTESLAHLSESDRISYRPY